MVRRDDGVLRAGGRRAVAVSGKDVAEKLAPARPEMAVLYMSGYTDNIVLDHGVSQKADAFIRKPLQPAMFLETVRKTLQGEVVATQ